MTDYARTGAVAYGTSSVTVTVPTVAAEDLMLLVVGAKPATANGLSWSGATPAGYSLLGQKNNAGGYGTTLGADTGNTSIVLFDREAVGDEDGGTVTVTPGGSGSDSCWGVFVIFSKTDGGTWSLATATGTDTSTSNGMTLAMGTDPGIEASDYLLGAFCDPTNAQNGANLSGAAMSCTGVTIGTVTEVAEPCTSLNNNVAGLVAVAPVSSGDSAGNVLTFSATAVTGTNVKGPGILVRIRELAAPSLGCLLPFFF